MLVGLRYLYVLSLITLVNLSGCCQGSIDPGVVMKLKKVPLISRKILFGNPDHVAVKISPDGKKVSYLAPFKGVLNIWVADVGDLKKGRAITSDKKRGIHRYGWSYTNRHILYVQDEDGDENWQLFSIDLQTDKITNLTPFKKIHARILEASHLHPYELLVSVNDRRADLHDIYHINIETGKRIRILENNEFIYFVTDDDLKVRFGAIALPDGGNEIHELDDKGNKIKLFARVSMEEALTTSPLGFNKSGDILYMSDSRDSNTSALVAVDLKTNKKTIIASDSKADFSDVISHPTEKTIEAFASTYDRKKWQILDPSIQKDMDYLSIIDLGDFEITSRNLDDTLWIVAYLKDNAPVRYYIYNRPNKEARYLFSSRLELENQPLVSMHPVIIMSRDGYELVSYLSLPKWVNPKDLGARPTQPVPMVLLVHGGPWARDGWGYDAEHQWLTNRGYAVLSVNYRGSTGFGKMFLNAGNGEWAAKMHDDLLDAVNWAIEEKITTFDQVAIMGGSYGGYATLVGLTFTPDVFACGVDIVGVSNLITLLESIPEYWKPALALIEKQIGGDVTSRQGRTFLASRSPLTYVDRISKPLLIAQGANDPRVKQAESDQIVNAMREKNIPVTYALFSDEGHGFARPENRLAFYAVVEEFLNRCLSGRIEPVGQDFEGSSINVNNGSQ